MIPLYGCLAGSGKIYSLDDQTVVVDGAALDGTGGTAFTPFLVSAPFNIAADLGISKLRRFLQRITHAGAVTVAAAGVRDGLESSVVITRALAAADIGVLNFPLDESASDFQLKLTLSGFTAEVALGDAQIFVVPRRRYR